MVKDAAKFRMQIGLKCLKYASQRNIITNILIFWRLDNERRYSEGSEKKMGKGCVISCAFIAVIIILIAVFTSRCGKSSSKPSSSGLSNFASESLTESGVKSAISNSAVKSLISSIKISGGTVTVVTDNADALSLKSFVELNQSYSAGVFQDLFKNKDVDTVIYEAQIPVQDAYGKTTIVTGQTNTMKRADAEKISDWNTFAYENPSQFYSVVQYELAAESQVSGIHKAWTDNYK